MFWSGGRLDAQCWRDRWGVYEDMEPRGANGGIQAGGNRHHQLLLVHRPGTKPPSTLTLKPHPTYRYTCIDLHVKEMEMHEDKLTMHMQWKFACFKTACSCILFVKTLQTYMSTKNQSTFL